MASGESCPLNDCGGTCDGSTPVCRAPQDAICNEIEDGEPCSSLGLTPCWPSPPEDAEADAEEACRVACMAEDRLSTCKTLYQWLKDKSDSRAKSVRADFSNCRLEGNEVKKGANLSQKLSLVADDRIIFYPGRILRTCRQCFESTH